MQEGRPLMNKRINISLPEGTLRALDRVVAKGQRDRLIDQTLRNHVAKIEAKKTSRDPIRAAQRCVDEIGRVRFRRILKAQFAADVARDRESAAEWDALADEVWQRSES